MQINASNAAVAHAVLSALADPRFSMRTLGAIVTKAIPEGEVVPTLDPIAVANVAIEMGLPIRHRSRDGAPLIQRPEAFTAEQFAADAEKAKAVVDGIGEPFDVDYEPVAEMPASTEGDGSNDDEDL